MASRLGESRAVALIERERWIYCRLMTTMMAGEETTQLDLDDNLTTLEANN